MANAASSLSKTASSLSKTEAAVSRARVIANCSSPTAKRSQIMPPAFTFFLDWASIFWSFSPFLFYPFLFSGLKSNGRIVVVASEQWMIGFFALYSTHLLQAVNILCVPLEE